ncbi:serine hydrolase domain-containing protein [Flagellimonas allohymeniacidonis]|uniref:Class A beta-lactamase-related serine hydrolase n=1 Tax=Flagellimonas allohymeniacidonis TaxID=2517819 RepID=A0A4Q8QBY4_9FLAO|nr:serine hydrolase domain-containing protein [Allomuricauda hymeniacidonis]TAI46917.1 class A beta-lactamase-related serine hydrolase [Allomuricauda hymeniacidonis]
MKRFFSRIQNWLKAEPRVRLLEDLEGREKSDAILHNLFAESRIPGISITITSKEEILLQKGYGYSDMERKVPVDPKKTPFRIASISKCITAMALGKMVEEGVIQWDDSFYKHVPYYPKKKYDFTLRQLAAHTAGIRGYRGKEFALNRPYSIKDSLQVFQNDPLVFEPGMGYLYNSYDFVLLSLAMQEASGIPFENYVQEKILIPLGMSDTSLPRKDGYESKRKNPNPQFYTKNTLGFRNAVPVNNFYKLAGGGYLSTSDDIARLGQAIIKQELLTSATYTELLSSQTVNGKPTYYGLGFQVSQDEYGRPFVGHVGNSVGAYTNFFVYPNEEVVFTALINCSDPNVQQDLDSSRNLFF